MLLGSFFQVTESVADGHTYRAKATFNPSHPIFKGHFPDLPVVPGVCQTQMLLETLGLITGRSVELKKAQHIKFLALLNPTKVGELMMEIKVEKTEGDYMLVSAVYSTPEEVFFRFKGELYT